MAPTISAEQARERINAALDAIDAAHDELRETSSDLAGNMFRVDVAERLETQERTNRGLMYRSSREIADPPDEAGSMRRCDLHCGRDCASRPTKSPVGSSSQPGSGRAAR